MGLVGLGTYYAYDRGEEEGEEEEARASAAGRGGGAMVNTAVNAFMVNALGDAVTVDDTAMVLVRHVLSQLALHAYNREEEGKEESLCGFDAVRVNNVGYYGLRIEWARRSASVGCRARRTAVCGGCRDYGGW